MHEAYLVYYPFDTDDITNLLHLYIIFPLLSFSTSLPVIFVFIVFIAFIAVTTCVVDVILLLFFVSFVYYPLNQMMVVGVNVFVLNAYSVYITIVNFGKVTITATGFQSFQSYFQ